MASWLAELKEQFRGFLNIIFQAITQFPLGSEKEKKRALFKVNTSFFFKSNLDFIQVVQWD